jgi:hypothetical protein
MSIKGGIYEFSPCRPAACIFNPDRHPDSDCPEVLKLFCGSVFDCHRYSGIDAFGASLILLEKLEDTICFRYKNFRNDHDRDDCDDNYVQNRTVRFIIILMIILGHVALVV